LECYPHHRVSQSNPLKAIAEFVENSIDAHAKTVAITRGREHGEHYLTVKDDGDGVPRDPNGLPDFKYSRLISATRSSDA
jgi:nitrate/nitrite-specific signal transduction histidine kinase